MGEVLDFTGQKLPERLPRRIEGYEKRDPKACDRGNRGWPTDACDQFCNMNAKTLGEAQKKGKRNRTEWGES